MRPVLLLPASGRASLPTSAQTTDRRRSSAARAPCARGQRIPRIRCSGRALRLPGIAVLLASLACAAPAPQHTLVLEVTNQLERSIAEIRRKPCDDLEIALKPIEGSRLAAGASRGFVLPASCVDLVAFDERGRVVGEQRGLRMLPGATWVLRR